MTAKQIAQGQNRKSDHLTICSDQPVESVVESAFAPRGLLVPEALPELDFEQVDLSVEFLDVQFSSPFLITGMTGGIDTGKRLNNVFAYAAETLNIPLGLGSMRLMIEDPSLKSQFHLRPSFPKVFLIGNLGAVSLNYGIDEWQICSLVEDLELNAFALHLNALQECIQPEGNRNFSGLLKKIERVVRACPVPIVVKEVGSGIAPKTLKKLIEVGVSAVDVGGNGGTSWSVIEGYRGSPHQKRLGELFRNWGLSTASSLSLCEDWMSKSSQAIPLIATGGVRDGLHAAQLIAKGARLVGLGLPLLRAATKPMVVGLTLEESVLDELKFFVESLKIAMFCSGCENLKQLKSCFAQVGANDDPMGV